MKLDELARREVATIIGVAGERRFRRRLLELGLVPGTEVELVGRAPLGDPLAFRVRGAVVTLRVADASRVQVER